ncbi:MULTISPECIES: hypothetical protein [unclassified Butyrivibrio]|uniref:hypothetical protein n=1 Tax=unclassified Butyrivibrio TaxID=2639466 RepID=UPI0003B60872|nr:MULTISPECIES: hypothetical protein [unclassified Butyrivibrio]SEK46251.1 hypothetical protein SAMN04487770_101448 [Butyrivibrio sp. ob235]
MKKVFKILSMVILASVIVFSYTPHTVSAAAYSQGMLNTSAKENGTYTIKTYFPGIGYQKMKVRFDTVEKKDGEFVYNGKSYKAKRAKVSIHCYYPKSTLNKIKNNAAKIVMASKHKNSALDRGSFILDADTGRLGSVLSCKMIVTNRELKKLVQRKGNVKASYTITQNWDVTYDVTYPKKSEGKLLIGITGVKKEIGKNSGGFSEFSSGRASITSTPYFKKNMKSLSIWTKI